MPEGDELLFVVLAFVFLAVAGGAGSFFLWVKVLGGRGPLLPLARSRPITWTGREVIMTFALLFLVPDLALSFLKSIHFFEAYYGEVPSLNRQLIWAMLPGAPLLVALIIMVLFFAGTRPGRLGLSAVRWPQNLLAGYLAWLVLTPLVWAVHSLIVLVIEPQPHIFEKLLEKATPVEWTLVFLQALLGAPVYEELVFRGVLQGWLRKASPAGHYAVAAAAFLAAALSLLNLPDPGPIIFVALLVPVYVIAAHRLAGKTFYRMDQVLPPPEKGHDPISAPEEPGIVASERGSGIIVASQVPVTTESIPENPPASPPTLAIPEPTPQALGFLAIGGTSLLFATFHADTWPAPIPLLFLSLGLGWLAQRTQSLIGPMVLHSLFNGISCFSLLINEFARAN